MIVELVCTDSYREDCQGVNQLMCSFSVPKEAMVDATIATRVAEDAALSDLVRLGLLEAVLLEQNGVRNRTVRQWQVQAAAAK